MYDNTDKKVAEELQKFVKFKENFKFTSQNISEKDGVLYCEGLPIFDEKGKYIAECDKWINVGYVIMGPFSKTLSNLYPYEFDFRGFHLHSLESFFQGLKFKNPEIQKLIFAYSGTDAYHIQAASDYNWKESGYVYWQGQPIKRDSTEYDLLVDEAYISMAQNPLYRMALKNVNKPLIHSMGKHSKTDTLLTRYEFEKQINCLSAFLKQSD